MYHQLALVLNSSWADRSNSHTIEITVDDETFLVHKGVVVQNSEYFATSMKEYFTESDGHFTFTDISPKYFALFVGVLYSYSSLVPHAPPQPAQNPEVMAKRTMMRDYVEVYKLCDRFLCPEIAVFIRGCINTAIGNGHRALFRSWEDTAQQISIAKDFGAAYEALDQDQEDQASMGLVLIRYYYEGMAYKKWGAVVKELGDMPKFVTSVSVGLALKLSDMCHLKVRPRRKELLGP